MPFYIKNEKKHRTSQSSDSCPLFHTHKKGRPKEQTQGPIAGVRQETGWTIWEKLAVGAAKSEVRQRGMQLSKTEETVDQTVPKDMTPSLSKPPQPLGERRPILTHDVWG